MTEGTAMRNITFLCQRCRADLYDTGLRLQRAPVYRCSNCLRLFRWWRYEWREVEGPSPLRAPARTAK